jgi:PAS domain S-box-containing protein
MDLQYLGPDHRANPSLSVTGGHVRTNDSDDTPTESRSAKAGQADKAFRAAEERLDLALDAAGVGFWDLDLLNHTAYRSPQHDRIFGYESPLPEWTYEMFLDHVVPEDRAVVADKFRGAQVAGDDWDFECRVCRADGQIRWVWARGRQLQGEGGGRRMVGLVRDVSERKEAEEALRETAERLSMALDVGNAGVWEWNLVRHDVHFDDRFHALLGYAPGDLPNSLEEWLTYHHPGDMPAWQAKAKAYLEGKSPAYESEHRIRNKTGTWEWVYTRGRIVSFTATGSPERFVGIAMNVTGRKQAEEERLALERQLQQGQKLESLGVLAGGVAHDFNNILTSVLASADLALAELTPASPVWQNLVEITQAANRAASLSRQMLAYSGRGRFSMEAVDLSAFIEDMLDLLRGAISKKAVLELNLQRDLPLLEGDPNQLSQLVMNLVLNASEVIGDEGVITVSTGTVECPSDYLRDSDVTASLSPGLYVTLEVSDTGCGMDQETQQRMFEPFFTTKFTGRGLGLAAVQGIVRGHNGALRCSSELGKGTVFKVVLPASETKRGSPLPKSDSRTGDWRGEGIVLLVDDEETIRDLGARMLSHMGFEVLTAVDGREALELYAEHGGGIVLVLLDLTMPHMDGEETFRELRALDPSARVVMSSGYSETDITAHLGGEGLAGFLQKPYTRTQLAEAVRSALGGC